MGDDSDRSVTEYFVVMRTDSSTLAVRQRHIRGPLTKAELGGVAAKLRLPNFDKTFDGLQ